jgi:HEAT repeat protein
MKEPRASKLLLPLAATAMLLVTAATDARAGDKVAALVKDLSAKDESVRLNAALELGKLGKPAVEPVAAALADKDADTRYYAVWALGLLGPDARDKTPDVIKLLRDADAHVRRKAIYSLGRIGPAQDAVPALIRVFADDDPDLRAAAEDACARFGKAAVPALIKAAESAERPLRFHGILTLGRIGPDAGDALPVLTVLLNGKDQRLAFEAAAALAKLGKQSLPALTAALNSDNHHLRHDAVEAIAKIEGREAIVALVDALKSPYADVRWRAAQGLGQQQVNDKLVIMSLAEALTKDPDAEVRSQSVHALARFGPNARPAAEALKGALADQHPQVRQLAVYALFDAKLDAAVAVREHFKNPDVRVRVNVASAALARLDRDHPEAIEVLTAALEEKDGELRRQAAFSLAGAFHAPGKTVDVLAEALKNGKPRVREQAVDHLARLGEAAEKALPALTAALKDEEPRVRRAACNALARSTVELKAAMTALVPALKDEDAEVRLQALLAVWHRVGAEGFPHYVEAMKDPDGSVRSLAVDRVASSKKAGPELLPQLRDLALNDKQQSTRYGATIALGHMGAEAVPALVELLPVKNGDIQRTVMVALQQHGAKSRAAVPGLVAILKETGHQYRWLAAQTLGTIGSDAKDAVAALKDAARDQDEMVRSEAEKALRLIEKK